MNYINIITKKTFVELTQVSPCLKFPSSNNLKKDYILRIDTQTWFVLINDIYCFNINYDYKINLNKNEITLHYLFSIFNNKYNLLPYKFNIIEKAGELFVEEKGYLTENFQIKSFIYHKYIKDNTDSTNQYKILLYCNYKLKKIFGKEYDDYLTKLNKYYYDYTIILYILNKNILSRLSFYSYYLEDILLEKEKNTNFNLAKYFEDDIVKLLSEKQSKPNKGIFNSLRQYSLRQYRYEILFFNKKFLNKFIKKNLNNNTIKFNYEDYNIFRKITFLRFYFNYSNPNTLAKRFNKTKKINYIVDDNKTFKTFLKKNRVIFEKDDEYKKIIDYYIKYFDTKIYKRNLNKNVNSKNEHFENIKLLRNTIYENTNKIIDYYIVLNIDTEKDNIVNFNIKNNTNISTKTNNKITSTITGEQSL